MSLGMIELRAEAEAAGVRRVEADFDELARGAAVEIAADLLRSF